MRLHRNTHFTRRFVAVAVAIALSCVLSATALAQNISIGLSQSQYVTDSTASNQTNAYSNVLPSVQGEGFFLKGFLKGKADLHAVVPLSNDDDFNLWFPEMYGQVGDIKPSPNSDSTLVFTFGRKKEEWSRLDEEWGLGLWQPEFRWDYVRPQQMGLTGLFIESRRRDVSFLAFVSGIHLPDQQANFKVVDGKLVSSSRWFRPPISSLQIQQDDRDIMYDVDKPKVSEVIFNPSVGFAIQTGDRETGPWAGFAIADKPANQFHVAIETKGINNLNAGNIQPIIRPSLIRHKLATAEAGLQGERTGVYVSATAERFDKPNLPEMWEQTPLRDSNYYGAGISRNTRILNTRTLVYSGFVYRDEKKETDSGLMSAQLSSSTQKMSFERLWSIGARYPVYPQRHIKWSSELKYTYSFSDKGEWLSGQIGYSPEVNWRVYFGFDVFGAPDEFDGVQSFISKYRDNDRIEGGLSHVF